MSCFSFISLDLMLAKALGRLGVSISTDALFSFQFRLVDASLTVSTSDPQDLPTIKAIKSAKLSKYFI
jgi:hypothetical protein